MTAAHPLVRRPAAERQPARSAMPASTQEEPSAAQVALRFDDIPVLQRKCASCKDEEETHEKLARKEQAGSSPQARAGAPAIVKDVLRESGRPLDPAARAFFEPRFGFDFSKVRLHTSSRAAEAAHAVSARAFTVGQDVVFGASQFAPATTAGSRLMSHELAHVVQQHRIPGGAAFSQNAPAQISSPRDPAEREADHAAEAIDRGERAPAVRERPATIARAAFDVDAIAADADKLANTPVQIGSASLRLSSLFAKYLFTPASGTLTFAADYPTTLQRPFDKTKPLPKADKATPLSNIPVEAHFFPTPQLTNRRALVLGGFHGDEQPGWQMVEALIKDIQAGNFSPAFHTIVVPRVNAGGITDELNNVHMWHNRCNRQLVDLNRNFPVAGQTPKATDCPNTDTAPLQPETKAVIDLVTKFKPDRILSAHDIKKVGQTFEGGVFADPNQDKDAVKLARGMASTLVNPSDREHNKLSPTNFNPVYPGDTPGKVGGGTTLGAFGPTAIPGRTTPVITIEAPGDAPLATGPGTQARTVEAFERPLRAFLSDPDQIDTQADRDILSDIDALNAADRVSFLTGRAPVKDAITERIRQRVLTAVENLKALGPPKPLTAESHVRLADQSIPNAKGGSAQAEIDFDKFFLTGSRANGWDTLPAQFWENGKVNTKPDRDKWLNKTSSKDRLAEILKFSSLPGTSRHHWATEVDFNSTNVEDWLPGKKFGDLGAWLDRNAAKANFIRAYTPGRTGGYNDEPWHFSYAPISAGLRDRYNKQVNLQTDVVDKLVADFKQRAAARGLTLPADFAAAVAAINISDLVNNVGPGL